MQGFLLAENCGDLNGEKYFIKGMDALISTHSS